MTIGLSSCGDPKGYHSFDPNCPNENSYDQNQCPGTIALNDKFVLDVPPVGFVARLIQIASHGMFLWGSLGRQPTRFVTLSQVCTPRCCTKKY
jgi:hypothetical protein